MLQTLQVGRPGADLEVEIVLPVTFLGLFRRCLRWGGRSREGRHQSDQNKYQRQIETSGTRSGMKHFSSRAGARARTPVPTFSKPSDLSNLAKTWWAH